MHDKPDDDFLLFVFVIAKAAAVCVIAANTTLNCIVRLSAQCIALYLPVDTIYTLASSILDRPPQRRGAQETPLVIVRASKSFLKANSTLNYLRNNIRLARNGILGTFRFSEMHSIGQLLLLSLQHREWLVQTGFINTMGK